MPTPPKTLDVTQCHALLDKLLVTTGTPLQFKRGVRNYTLGALLLETGLRVNELVLLTVDDLSWQGSPVATLTVRPEIAKNKKERSVPISSRLSEAIAGMNQKVWQPDGAGAGDFAFYPRIPGIHVTSRQVERIINAAGRQACGIDVWPHMLRHTFATKVLAKSNTRVTQMLLGHSSLQSTQIYTHPNNDELRKAVE
jgi:site-specific recombinase XerD